MKKKMKKILTIFMLCAMSVFACMATGCAMSDKLGDKIEQLECKHEYDEGIVTKAATCTTSGKLTRTCILCEKEKIELIPAIGHKYDDGIIMEVTTCTKAGRLLQTCENCESELVSTIPAPGHNWDSGVALEEATCSAVGKFQYTCMDCGEVKTQTIAKLPHTIVDVVGSAATCMSTGLTDGKRCMTCGTIVMQQTIIPALGHDVVRDAAVAPTCTQTGLSVGNHCARCDEILVAQEVIPAVGHTIITEAAVAPSCVDVGYTAGSYCGVCGTVYSGRTEVAALGHDFVGVQCSRCDEMTNATFSTFQIAGAYAEKSFVLSDDEFDYVSGLYFRFYKTDGTDFIIVSNCGGTSLTFETQSDSLWLHDAMYRDKEIPLANNNLVSYVEYDEYFDIYIESGLFSADIRESFGNESLGISDVSHVIHSSGEVYRLVPTHNKCVAGNGVVTKEPTCTEQGTMVYRCIYCVEVINTVSVAKVAHTYVYDSYKVAPTCKEDGIAIYKCSGCSETQETSVSAFGHTYIDDTCVTCGDKKYLDSGLGVSSVTLNVSGERPALEFTVSLSNTTLRSKIQSGEYSEFGLICVERTQFEKLNSETVDFITEMKNQNISFVRTSFTYSSTQSSYTYSLKNIPYLKINTEYVTFPYVVDGQAGANLYKYYFYSDKDSLLTGARSVVYEVFSEMNAAVISGTTISSDVSAKYKAIVNESAHLIFGYEEVVRDDGAIFPMMTKDSLDVNVGETAEIPVVLMAYVYDGTFEGSSAVCNIRIPLLYVASYELINDGFDIVRANGKAITKGAFTFDEDDYAYWETDDINILASISWKPSTVPAVVVFDYFYTQSGDAVVFNVIE